MCSSDLIALADAKTLWETGATFFLDARAPADYAAGHIANALDVPVEQFDETFPQVAPMLAPDSSIVCYCDGVDCELSHRLVALLRQNGYANVRLIVNGWTEWRQAGYPTHAGEKP